MTDETTVFDWWGLFTHGGEDDGQRTYWNSAIYAWYSHALKGLYPDLNFAKLEKLLPGLPIYSGTKADVMNNVRADLVINDLPPPPDSGTKPFMDFSVGKKFKEHVDFSRRLFIGASFRNVQFEQGADFSGAVFLGYTDFGKLKSQGSGTGASDGLQFKGASFHGTAHFIDAEIRPWAGFEDVTFHGLAHFQRAKFEPAVGDRRSRKSSASFSRSRFKTRADFEDTTFIVNANFIKTGFQGSANFEPTEFHNKADFTNASFGAATSFRGAVFDKPPKFFEATLHEDTDFGLVKWERAEESYRHSWWRDEPSTEVKKAADNAARAWDRLALIMSQRERPFDRHEFFRLKMRAQRYCDGRRLTSFLDWLYEKSADYGWGVGRTLFLWLSHIAAGTTFLTLFGLAYLSPARPGFWSAFVYDCVWVSFTNAHAILGLASTNGYLSGPRERLKGLEHADWLQALNTIGTTQAVIGPILLFLVLLTLRNRFRLG